jgi:DNA-directed RNA polymerase specialized sigma24 family protein
MSETAFNKGISDFREPMVTYALSLTKNNEDAQDLVQDALFKALKYKNNYVENQNLKGWLITILRNTFLNIIGIKSVQFLIAWTIAITS